MDASGGARDHRSVFSSSGTIGANHVVKTASEKLEEELRQSKGASSVVDAIRQNILGADNSASPALKPSKRTLTISPTTPVGLTRKILCAGAKKESRMLEFENDVEMTDMEEMSAERNVNHLTQHAARKTFTARRRRDLGLDLSTGLFSPCDRNKRSMTETELTGDTDPDVPRDVATHNEGMNVKLLQSKVLNKKKYKTAKNPNYKSTKKKKSKSQDLTGRDSTQSLIPKFFDRLPNNKTVIVGKDGDCNGVDERD